MKVDIEFEYPVEGVPPRARSARRGVALFRKAYEVPEVEDGRVLPKAFALSAGVMPMVDRTRNPEGHDVTGTILRDGRPFMAVNENSFHGEPSAFLDLSRVLNNAVRHRLDARRMRLADRATGFPGPRMGLSEPPLDRPSERAETFREITADPRAEYEAVADEVMAKFVIYRDRAHEADVVPLYAVHGGDRPDVTVVPSSAARHTYFDHFLPDDNAGAFARFAAQGGRGRIPSIDPAIAFDYPDHLMRRMLLRTAHELVGALQEGIDPDMIERWHRRIGGETLVRAVKFVKVMTADPGMLPASHLHGSLETLRGAVRAAMHLAPEDPIARALDLVDNRLDMLARHGALRDTANLNLPA